MTSSHQSGAHAPPRSPPARPRTSSPPCPSCSASSPASRSSCSPSAASRPSTRGSTCHRPTPEADEAVAAAARPGPAPPASTRVVFVVYADDGPPGRARSLPAAAPGLRRAGIEVVEVLRAHDGRWFAPGRPGAPRPACPTTSAATGSAPRPWSRGSSCTAPAAELEAGAAARSPTRSPRRRGPCAGRCRARPARSPTWSTARLDAGRFTDRRAGPGAARAARARAAATPRGPPSPATSPRDTSGSGPTPSSARPTTWSPRRRRCSGWPPGWPATARWPGARSTAAGPSTPTTRWPGWSATCSPARCRRRRGREAEAG